MKKSEVLKKLNKAFGDFEFFDQDHHYEYKGIPVGISVTRLIDEYVNEFDAESVAYRVALKQDRPVRDILDEWQYKNEFSKAKGHTCHEFAQCLWNGLPYTWLDFGDDHDYNMAVIKIQNQARDFYESYKNLFEHVADEFVVGSVEYDVASAIDHLFISKDTGGLIIVDYKTNTDLYKNESYAKFMKPPLSHLKDTKINHYYIQLSIYKFLIETYTDLKVEDTIIVWFSENNDDGFKTIQAPYLEKEVKSILEWRKFE